MEEENVVILIDEDGKELPFLHIMTFDFEGSFFVALTPQEDTEDIESGEVLLMEILEDEDGNDSYVPIESEDRLDKIWEEFERLYYEDDEEGDDDDEEEDDENVEEKED